MRQAYLPLFIYSLRYNNWVIVDGILNFIDVSSCLPRTRVADGTVSNIMRGTRFVQISRLNLCHSCETNRFVTLVKSAALFVPNLNANQGDDKNKIFR